MTTGPCARAGIAAEPTSKASGSFLKGPDIEEPREFGSLHLRPDPGENIVSRLIIAKTSAAHRVFCAHMGLTNGSILPRVYLRFTGIIARAGWIPGCRLRFTSARYGRWKHLSGAIRMGPSIPHHSCRQASSRRDVCRPSPSSGLPFVTISCAPSGAMKPSEPRAIMIPFRALGIGQNSYNPGQPTSQRAWRDRPDVAPGRVRRW